MIVWLALLAAWWFGVLCALGTTMDTPPGPAFRGLSAIMVVATVLTFVLIGLVGFRAVTGL
jgi:hypothetical protein